MIPKSEGEMVMIVGGRHKGQAGEMISKDKAKSRLSVKLQRSHEVGTFLMIFSLKTFFTHYYMKNQVPHSNMANFFAFAPKMSIIDFIKRH